MGCVLLLDYLSPTASRQAPPGETCPSSPAAGASAARWPPPASPASPAPACPGSCRSAGGKGASCCHHPSQTSRRTSPRGRRGSPPFPWGVLFCGGGPGGSPQRCPAGNPWSAWCPWCVAPAPAALGLHAKEEGLGMEARGGGRKGAGGCTKGLGVHRGMHKGMGRMREGG